MRRTDQELAAQFRRTHQHLMEMRQELEDRGFTSQTYIRENGESVRQELRTLKSIAAQSDTVKFHKTQVTTITV